jgi:hypothetical protein
MQPPIFVLLILLFFGAVITFYLNNRFRVREIEHRETLAAMEKGVPLPERQTPPWSPRTYLLHGMIWLFAGLASMFALFGLAATSSRPITAAVKVAAANDARFRGATPEEIQMILNQPQGMEQGVPIGIGLLGLIPIGIGMAYLIFYRVESRKPVN